MTTEERRALLDRAITAYGAPAQMDMTVEEMAELTKALCKRLKNRLDGRNNWQGSSLHKWIEKQFSTGGDGHE